MGFRALFACALPLGLGAVMPVPAPLSFQEPLPEVLVATASATKLAGLSNANCRAELVRRKIETKPPKQKAPAVASAVTLAAPASLSGVKFVAPNGIYGIMDCRLVLALDDFAGLLSSQGITEVRLDNAYRPKAHLPGKKNKLSQHALGLAADVLSFKLSDGRVVKVEDAWRGAIGDPVCGPKATLPEMSQDAVLLRNIVCEAARGGIFHHILTPNHDAAHRSHLHLDIAKNVHHLMIE